MQLYSIPYLLLILWFVLLSIKEVSSRSNEDLEKKLRLCCIISYVLFFGFRGLIATDWLSYYPWFENLDIKNLFNIGYWKSHNNLISFEAGFTIYSMILKKVSDNYFFFQFISTCLDVLVLNYFLRKYSPYYVLGFLVFFVFQGIGYSTNLLRNVKSLMLFLLSIQFLLQRKPLYYFSLNILGMLFHSSAILYLPLYFFVHRNWPRSILIASFIIGNFIFFFNIDIVKGLMIDAIRLLGGKYELLGERYLSGQEKVISVGYFERILTCLLVIFNYKKLISLRKEMPFFLNIYTLYFTFYYFFSGIEIISLRLSILFIFSYWVIWPSIYKIIALKKNKQLFLLFIFIFSFFKVNGITNNIFYRYGNIIWKAESFETRKNVFYRSYHKLKKD